MMLVYITCIFMAVASVNAGQENVLTKSNGLFSARMYDVIKKDGNILISPLSLNYALTAISLGANGKTLQEIRSALNQPDDKNAIISSYRAYTDSLKNDKILSTATKMYVDNNFKVKDQFKKELTKDFDADIENINIQGEPEQSRIIINKYVDNRTHHRIPELLPKGSVSAATASVLVNAVYFKAQWKYAFNTNDTEKAPFYGLDGEHEVDMMALVDKRFKYLDSNELNAQMIELPYEGGYSFLAILPKEKNGITELENKILSKANNANASPFIDSFKDAYETKVEVYIPKFTFQRSYSLKESLEKMGIIEAFRSANFSSLSETPVAIDAVIQNTFIKVDEVGTEAAAATAIIDGLIASPFYEPPEHIIFRADHPFIFAIKDGSTQTPLFVGTFFQNDKKP